MGSQNTVTEAISSIVGGLPGGDILDRFKDSLLTEGIFQKLFGAKGERIICNKQVSLNTAIVPMLELRFRSDTAQSQETYIDGRIEGRLVFPASLKDDDLTIRRKAAFAIIRFLRSDRFDLFERVPGLIEFGKNINFNYAVAFQVAMDSLPGILIDIPYRIDVHKWEMAHPEIDPSEPMDGNTFDVDTYGFGYKVEKDGNLETVMTDTFPNEDE
jgi:hypothetical protein